MSIQDFPTDDTTLHLLIAACEINPDTGQTHLHDFLDMGTRVKSQELLEGDENAETLEEAPVYFVEYEEGFAPFSEHHVIKTLARELMDCRARLDGANR